MKELTLSAAIDAIPEATAFVDSILEEADCPMKAQMQIDIAIDELFSNIARYAYPEDAPGSVTLRVETEEDPPSAKITFIDRGIPYDPLKKEDPDVTLALEDRQAGGLGIFMVKKSMDEMEYEYRDGRNILTIRKYF